MDWLSQLRALGRATPDVGKLVADRTKLMRQPYIVRAAPGLQIELRPGGADRFVFSEIFAFGAYDDALAYLRPGMTVVDVGANVGLFSLAAAARMQGKGRVIAVEPIPETFAQTERNLRSNSVGRIVTPLQCAIADQTGEVTMRQTSNPLFSSLYSKVDGRNDAGKGVKVTSLSLRDLFDQQDIETCDLLKLDCEGGEHLLVPGISLDLAARINALAIEFHDIDDRGCGYLIERLSTLGYRHSVGQTHFFEREAPTRLRAVAAE